MMREDTRSPRSRCVHEERVRLPRKQPSKKQLRCIAVDVFLGLALMCLILAEFLPDGLHRVAGIAFTALLVVHVVQHRVWFKVLFRGRWNGKRALSTLVNLGIGAVIIFVALLGFAVPSAVSFYVSSGGFAGIAQVHHVLGYASALLALVHVLYNARKRIHAKNKKTCSNDFAHG